MLVDVVVRAGTGAAGVKAAALAALVAEEVLSPSTAALNARGVGESALSGLMSCRSTSPSAK